MARQCHHTIAAFQRRVIANKLLCVEQVTVGVIWLGFTNKVCCKDNETLDIVSSIITHTLNKTSVPKVVFQMRELDNLAGLQWGLQHFKTITSFTNFV